VERGDTGLGRDAYGPPGRHAYGLDDGYQPPSFEEEDETAGAGEPVAVEDDDYGQPLRRPGETPTHEPHQPHQQRAREPGSMPVRPPGQFTPNLSPSVAYGGPVAEMPGAALANGGFHSGVPGAGLVNRQAHDINSRQQ